MVWRLSLSLTNLCCRLIVMLGCLASRCVCRSSSRDVDIQDDGKDDRVIDIPPFWMLQRSKHLPTHLSGTSVVSKSGHTRRNQPQSGRIHDASRDEPFTVLGIVEAITSLQDGIPAIGRMRFDGQLEYFPVRRFHRNRFFDQKLGFPHL